MMGTLTAYPGSPTENASTLLVYQGTPRRAVNWRLTGSGALAALSPMTNHAGVAAAVYTPGMAGETVLIEVDAGA